MFRRTTYQQGSLKLEERKRGSHARRKIYLSRSAFLLLAAWRRRFEKYENASIREATPDALIFEDGLAVESAK